MPAKPVKTETFRVTFGQKYSVEPHPRFNLIHPGRPIKIVATDYDDARQFAQFLLGSSWCDLYSPESWAEAAQYFSGDGVTEFTTPRAAGEPGYLLIPQGVSADEMMAALAPDLPTPSTAPRPAGWCPPPRPEPDISGHAPAECPAMSSQDIEAGRPHPCAEQARQRTIMPDGSIIQWMDGKPADPELERPR